jgi:hypothetical protein
MYGRYGSDTLNKTLLFVSVGLMLVNLFIRNTIASIIISVCSLLLLVVIYIRMFSRNIYKRQKENEVFVQFFRRLANIKKYKYFKCPSCKTKIRVPRNKGKIEITCPKCHNSFIKKS